MDSILSIVMVIVMAFTSLGGMTANLEEAVSFDAKISADAETILAMANNGAEATAETQQIMPVITDLLNVLTIKGVADKDASELGLFAGEDVVLSVGVKSGEEGAVLASSLLGNQVISVSAQTIQAMQQQMQASLAASASGADTTAIMNGVQNLDTVQIAADLAGVCTEMTKAFEEKKGETEAGEFTVDEMRFVSKTPVNMTYTEFMNLVLASMKELFGKESLQPIIQAAGKDTDLVAEIEKAIEKLNSQPEEEKPEAQFTVYADEKGNGYYVCDLTQETGEEGAVKTENAHIGIGEADGLSRIRFSADKDGEKMSIAADLTEDKSCSLKAEAETKSGTTNITLTADAAGNMNLVADILSAGTAAKIQVKTEPAEGDRTAFALELFFGNAEKPLFAVSGSAGKGGKLVSVFDGENVKTLPLESLMSSDNSTATSQLSMTMMAGMLKAVTTLTKNLPEESAAFVNNMVKQMMTPSSTTTTEQQSDTVTGQ